ncbi:MAG: hypothetical protein Q8S51_10760 [Rhodoferax sp.]|uniref:hypothetical protein n=1 Tax=Rhodoferax sp. TaxID=50421 RepID=UPI0027371FDF|nr:hypothetical protein [Rhodoferax sp.]MDP3337253.1 hypothetical protein [Rhodoferax sp.]
MTTKRTNKLNTAQSPTAAPLNIFADQPSAIQVGPYVTKFTLGVIEEDDSEFPRPVVTVAMPTVNLIRMVNDLQVIFSDPEFKKDSAKSLTSDVKKYFSSPGLSKTELSQQLVKRIPKAESSK